MKQFSVGEGYVGLVAGVHSVLATPFQADESLDLASIGSLVEFVVRAGVDGVLVLGVLGEVDRLSDAERDQVVHEVVRHAQGRLQVTVGVTHQSTVVTRARAEAALGAGATAVMVSPPVGSVAGSALREHFWRVADGLKAPLVVQDHPASSGVRMPVDFLVSLADGLRKERVIKLEEPATAPKIADLRAKSEDFLILGGLGGVALLDELAAGSHGTMTGFAFPEVLVEIVRTFHGGDQERARAVFERWFPVMSFEAQPGAGVALRKEILRRRGAIANATVRQPAAGVHSFHLARIEELLREFDPGV